MALLDERIQYMSLNLDDSNPQAKRELAIWIKERNKLAKSCDVPLIPLTEKDGTGQLIYA